MGVYLINVHLTGVHLMGMYLTGVPHGRTIGVWISWAYHRMSHRVSKPPCPVSSVHPEIALKVVTQIGDNKVRWIVNVEARRP